MESYGTWLLESLPNPFLPFMQCIREHSLLLLDSILFYENTSLFVHLLKDIQAVFHV